jgi:hypothetical protein
MYWISDGKDVSVPRQHSMKVLPTGTVTVKLHAFYISISNASYSIFSYSGRLPVGD